MYSVLGNHKTMTHRYTVNVIHIYRGIIVFTQHNLNKIFIKGSVDMFINLTLCDEQMTMIKSIAIVQYLIKSD